MKEQLISTNYMRKQEICFMKLTKTQLKKIIKEEIQKIVEQEGDASGVNDILDDEATSKMDSEEVRRVMQQLHRIESDVAEYIKQGEFDGARKHINAAWKGGAFHLDQKPEFAKQQWRRLRRMATNAKRKARRKSRSSVNRDALDKMGAKEDPRLKTPTPQKIATRKGYLPKTREFEKSVDASTRRGEMKDTDPRVAAQSKKNRELAKRLEREDAKRRGQ